MKLLKSISAFATLGILALCTSTMRADSINVSLSTGTDVDILSNSSILNGQSFLYTNTTTGGILSSSTSVLSGSYVDTLGTLGVLTLTDTCTTITVIGSVPCQRLTFSITDLTLTDISVITKLGADVTINGDVANISFGGGTSGGSIVLDFTKPASLPPATSPVPEPGTLSLMATGLLGAAGIVRKKFSAL